MTASPKLKALFDEDITPNELFQSFVREIGRYARIPKRVKTDISHGKSANGRLLSYREIGEIEEKMIREGSGLKPKYFKGGRKMRKSLKQVEARMGKLYDVIREKVAECKHFKTKMLFADVLLRARVTDSEGYLNRTVHEDLRRLVEKGLIYRRGRGASSAYYLGNMKDEERPEPKAKVKTYDCLGVAYGEIDECAECEADQHCHDVQMRLQEADKIEKDQYEERQSKEPLIPRHVAVDVNINLTLGHR